MNLLKRTRPALWTGLAALALGATQARADEWPQWMGPQRDNTWREKGILDKLPAGDLKPVWKAPIAGGYAGPAVAGGKVFATDLVSKDDVKVDNFSRGKFTGNERVLCYDEANGKLLWKHEYPVTYAISYPAGPRVTPTVADGKVYFLGAEGKLLCCAVEDGKILWQKDLKEEYKTKSALWGYASHPLIDGNRLICLAGGEGSHVVALDKDTGKEIWKAGTAKEQGYCPPSIINAGGVRQLVIPSPDSVVSLNPETGKQYWTTPYEATNGSIIMSPVVIGDYLFIAGYSNKNLLLKLAKDKPAVEVVWKDQAKTAISPVNVQPIVVDGTLYGFDQSGEMSAVEFPSGKRLWTTPEPLSKRPLGSGTAFIVRHEDKFFFFTETGHLVTGTLTPKGFTETSRAKLLAPTNNAFGRDVLWCAPAFANKRVYVRNDAEIAAFDLSR
ncbi:MAG: PQQ-binding-like beta-propeller repeat protein [Gemmataceae bacterium]|nr:PQQ-binding-like beta-propeller repeat protein [Gemmataceae bacterium]